MKRILSVILSATLILLCFTGCSSRNDKIDFIYPFSANVKSYDPQLASTSDEFLIIENTFEGLIRMDDNGEITPGVAESFTVSENKLVYTFKLKEGLKWNIDTELKDDGTRRKDDRLEYMGYDFNPDITADDFVFALQRACDPVTECPLFSSVACIKNATAIHNKKMNVNQLGVKASDKYTLQITLSSPDDSFLQSLTTAVAMPCNREFFYATGGRYGLSTKYTLFNGQFYLSQILETSYLLKNNKFYKGDSPATATELTLKINSDNDSADIISKLESGYYDAAFIRGADTEHIKDSENISYTPYSDTTWAFILNTNDEVFQSKTMRKAFCLGLTRSENTEKEYLSPATNLTPSSCKFGANNAVLAMGKTVSKQNIENSTALWKKGMQIVDKREIEFTIITTQEMQDYVKKMLQGIQSGIGSIVRDTKGNTVNTTIKVEAMSEDELKSAVKSRNYTVAFYPFRSSTDSAITFLKDVSESNYTGVDTKDMKKSLKKAENSGNLSNISSYTRDAEKAIIKSYAVIPMLYETSYYASAAGVSGIQFHSGTGRINFVNATRKK